MSWLCDNKRNTIDFWKSVLNLQEWEVICSPISEMQVLDDLYGEMPGHEFVGVVINQQLKIANIYHTRPLLDDDIIHELLHVRFPLWTEEEVNVITNKLCNSKEPIMFPFQMEPID